LIILTWEADFSQMGIVWGSFELRDGVTSDTLVLTLRQETFRLRELNLVGVRTEATSWG